MDENEAIIEREARFERFALDISNLEVEVKRLGSLRAEVKRIQGSAERLGADKESVTQTLKHQSAAMNRITQKVEVLPDHDKMRVDLVALITKSDESFSGGLADLRKMVIDQRAEISVLRGELGAVKAKKDQLPAVLTA